MPCGTKDELLAALAADEAERTTDNDLEAMVDALLVEFDQELAAMRTDPRIPEEFDPAKLNFGWFRYVTDLDLDESMLRYLTFLFRDTND